MRRSISACWGDTDASVILGDIHINSTKREGLTKFGAYVIRECNRLGILVDLAHCYNNRINAALKVAQHPILISDTGLNAQPGQNPNFAKMTAPRLISKEQAKIVADAGGAIGVWTHLTDSPTEFAAKVRAMADVFGVDQSVSSASSVKSVFRSKRE